jgi:signal transduction histidine kinase/ligand-binding sensor domain-containing protein
LLTDASGRLWVGTDKEIAVWKPEAEARSQSAIGHRQSTMDQRLVTSAATGFKNMTPTNGEPELAVTGMVATGEGIWVTANGRTRRCRDGQWVAEAPNWRPEPSLSTAGYYGDREGGIWGHFGTGLLHVRPDGEVHRITTEHGLANDRVACWFQDREGNIWAGLNRGGLVRVRPRHFQVLGVAEGLTDQVAMSVCEDTEGAIWIGTYGGGLNRWRDGVFTYFNLGPSDTPGIVVAVCPDEKGRVWIGTAGNGVWVHEQGEFKRRFSSEPLEDRAYAIFVDRSGGKWMGNRRGLFLWKNGKLRQYGTADGVPSTDVRAFAEDAAGAIWIGATDGPLYRFADGKFDRFRPPDALGRQPVYSLLADDDGTVWVGTFRGGLLRFKDGRFTRYTTREGLPNNVICHILDDGRGQLWMSSHQGIFRVTKTALHAFARGESQSVPCVAYGKFDGLPTLECTGNYQPAGWRGRDGRLWFATVKGVVSVQPEEVTVNPLPPPVVIEEVLVDGKSQITNRQSQILEIGPGRHHVEFHFTGLSFSAPDKVQFQYKLEGLDRDWLNAGGARAASYSYVPAGDYRFRVRACNNDGVWNEAGASLAFVVLPYFWQTWWFVALAALTAFGTVGGAIRFVEKRKLQRRLERLERERAIERERARIAQDIHDDLGASLTRITLLSESARDAGHGGEATTPEIDQIYSTARELTRAMDEIVWAVNPQHDTLDSLATYLGKFAQDFLRAAGVRCRLDMPVQLTALPLTSETRHNLFLAFKEALHNAVKHAAASEVRVQLSMDSSHFTLSVEDNGKGFTVNETSRAANGTAGLTGRLETGHGLRNMRQRLEEIGGRCEVETRRETGSRVRFIVPLPRPKA